MRARPAWTEIARRSCAVIVASIATFAGAARAEMLAAGAPMPLFGDCCGVAH